MNRIAIFIGLLILLVNLVRAWPDAERRRLPDARPAPPEVAQPPLPAPPPSSRAGRPVGPPGPNDPVSVIADRARQTADTVGTAFAIDRDGRWLTARHVIDQCNSVSLYVGERWVRAEVEAVHPTSDAALLRTPGVAGPPLPFGPVALNFEQDGFHLGYPKFEPGDVHSRLLGRIRVVHDRRNGEVEHGYTWAEIRRVPDRDASLGGMSGGPLVDSGGRLIGITIAESSRRGRITTSSPDTMRVLAGARAVEPPATRLDDGNFAAAGRSARAAFAIARVFCARTASTLPRVRRGEF